MRTELLAVGLTLLAPSAARAAHPLQSEDTGTQGTGRLELENGFSSTRAAGTSERLYQPQLSVGVTPALDAIVQPSWLRSRDETGTVVRGRGDTDVDVKWRFWARPSWSLAVRAGATLATGENGLGMRHGDVATHAVLVASYRGAPLAVHANLAWSQGPADDPQARRDLLRASAAAVWTIVPGIALAAEGSSASNPDASRSGWISTVLGGAICSVRPWLDIDVGVQATAHGAPASRAWLVGLTYRYAP